MAHHPATEDPDDGGFDDEDADLEYADDLDDDDDGDLDDGDDGDDGDDDGWALDAAIGAASLVARTVGAVGSSTPARLAAGATRRLTDPSP